jgi:hypothetical protein
LAGAIAEGTVSLANSRRIRHNLEYGFSIKDTNITYYAHRIIANKQASEETNNLLLDAKILKNNLDKK